MAMGTTLGALIERVKRDSLLVSRGQIYTVGTAYTANDTTLVLGQTPTHISYGSILSIDHELLYVIAVNAGTSTLTVIPGYFGTTPANHAENAYVEVDSRTPRCMLADWAQQEILSWGNELWRTSMTTIDVANGSRITDLGIAPGEDIYFLLDVRARPTGSSASAWAFSWTDNAWPHVDSSLMRDLSLTDFPSGWGIQTKYPTRRASEYRVAYAQPFILDPFVDATDLVADVGLRPEHIEIVEWGVRERAYQALIMGRTDFRAGSMSQEWEAVSTFDLMRAADQARSTKDLRRTTAGVNLRAEWPYRQG